MHVVVSYCPRRQSTGEGLAYTTMPTRDMDQAGHTQTAHSQVGIDPEGADDSPTIHPVKGWTPPASEIRGPQSSSKMLS